MSLVENKINKLKQQLKPKKANPILKRNDAMEYLKKKKKKKKIKKDLTSNNIAIICKYYFVEAILK